MTTDRDALVDAGREGFDSGRHFERTAVVEYLRREAAEWLAAYERGGTKAVSTTCWRNHAAYSTAAAKIESGRHTEEQA